MFNFKKHLDLINHHSRTHSFVVKDYDELIAEIGKQCGFTVVGSNIKSLGALSHLYVMDNSKQVAFLKTNQDDFKAAMSDILRTNPMPAEPRKVFIPQENSRHLKGIIRAVELEIESRERVGRALQLNDKFKTSCDFDEDGQVISGTQVNSAKKIVDGLLAGDKLACETFNKLMIVAPARTEMV